MPGLCNLAILCGSNDPLRIVPRFTTINRVLRLVGDLLRNKSHDRTTLAARLKVTPATADRLLRAVSTLPGIRSEDGPRRKLTLDATFADAPNYPTTIAACFGASLAPIFAGSSYVLAAATNRVNPVARSGGEVRRRNSAKSAAVTSSSSLVAPRSSSRPAPWPP